MTYSQEIQLFMQNMQLYLKPWLMILAALWCINILNWITGSYFNRFGINPRTLFGLTGIPVTPILHSNLSHLLLNSVPLFFLVLMLLVTKGAIETIWITLVVTVLGGLGVWLVARKGSHIGASGLISGYFGYVIMLAYAQPGVITVVTAFVALYYFGGIIFGIFPGKRDVSWESHFFGFISGILCVYIPNLLSYVMRG